MRFDWRINLILQKWTWKDSTNGPNNLITKSPNLESMSPSPKDCNKCQTLGRAASLLAMMEQNCKPRIKNQLRNLIKNGMSLLSLKRRSRRQEHKISVLPKIHKYSEGKAQIPLTIKVEPSPRLKKNSIWLRKELLAYASQIFPSKKVMIFKPQIQNFNTEKAQLYRLFHRNVRN